jgi:lipid-A-disaccharide synthase-like uncharacterized protein
MNATLHSSMQVLFAYIQSWDAWVWFGLVAQSCFFARFAVQWWASERAGRIVVPGAFWWLSLVGGSLVLVYAIVRRDPVFVLGYTFALVLYARNAQLHARSNSRDDAHRSDQIS